MFVLFSLLFSAPAPIAASTPCNAATTLSDCIEHCLAVGDAQAAACIDKIGPDELVTAKKADLSNLAPEVFALLSGESQTALGKIPGVTEGDSAPAVMLSDRNAIKPSLRIVGDAFGRVATGNNKDEDPEATSDGAFGGGLDVRTLNIRASLMIKKGTQPRQLTGEGAFGTAILLPQTENFAVTADFTWFPDWYVAHCWAVNQRSKAKDSWCRGEKDKQGAARDAWRYQLRRNLLLGPSFTGDVARTDWKHVLRPEQATGTMMMPEVAVTGQVTTIHAALGARYSWLRSHNDNWVEISVFAGASWRGVRVDTGANKELAKVWEDPPAGLEDSEYRAAGSNFLASALGTPRRDFFGADIGLSVRVNDVVVSAQLPYVAGHNISGLDGFRLIPMLSLRAGFELAKLGTEAKRTPST